MRTEPGPRLFTVDEYERMVEAGVLTKDDRVQLIEGVILEMPPIGVAHQSTVDRLNRLFTSALPADRAVVRVQGPVRLPPLSEPEPDLSLLHPSPRYYEDGHPEPGSVYLVVEVADTSLGFDRLRKVPVYAKRGLREVWLVDLPGGAIEVYRGPGPDGYRDVQRLPRGGTLTPEAFPYVTIPVEGVLPSAL